MLKSVISRAIRTHELLKSFACSPLEFFRYICPQHNVSSVQAAAKFGQVLAMKFMVKQFWPMAKCEKSFHAYCYILVNTCTHTLPYLLLRRVNTINMPTCV